MTHPHRINPCTNADIVKGIVFGTIQGLLSVSVPAAIAWYFFGGILQPKPPAPQVETAVRI